MELVKTGKQRTFPPDYEQVGMATASMCATRASNAELRVYDYEEALETDPSVAKWIQLVQLAALASHPYLQEDGPELPRFPASALILAGKFWRGSTPTAAHRSANLASVGNQEGQEARIQFRAYDHVIVSEDPRTVPTRSREVGGSF
jgi:hypothetical protein